MTSSPEPHLGYVLHPALLQSEPGYSRLDIWLSDHVSGLHFDPRQLRLPIASESGEVSYITVDHPHYGADKLRVCAGPLDVIGWGEKRLEVFTFGGELTVQTGTESSLAVLSSDAPVLVRVGASAAAVTLMEESELILALRKGVWDEQPGEFDRRLLLAEPLELYHAFLVSYLERVKSLPRIENESERHLLYELRQEVEHIEDHTDSGRRSIDEIL